MKNNNTSNNNGREIRPNPTPQPFISNTSNTKVNEVNARVYDIVNLQKSIKKLEFKRFGIDLFYETCTTTEWEDIIVLGSRYVEQREKDKSDINKFVSEWLLSIQILAKEFIDKEKNCLHWLICEHADLDKATTWILFQDEKWWYMRYGVPKDYALIKTKVDKSLVQWEDKCQDFYIDENNPEVFTLSEGMTLYENAIYIQDFSKENLSTFMYENIEYIYALRGKILFFYWEIVEKWDTGVSVQLLPNPAISSLWVDIIISIIATKWLSLFEDNIEVYFKRGGCSSFSPIEDISTDEIQPLKKEVGEFLPKSLQDKFIHE